MKLIGLVVIIVILAGVIGFIALAQKSKSGAPPGLVNGALTPCPSSPNCVSSEAGTPESRAAPPLPIDAWEHLPRLIEEKGGRVVVLRNDYIGAVFSTPLMGFVDDVEFRLAETEIHVRSASRVGHSDMGANAKRVEMLRFALED